MDEFDILARLILGIGSDNKEITAWQMGLRAVIVYVVTLAFVRLGKKRFMGKATAFDVILGIMLGSIASRAITGNAPFLPALAATAILVAMHSLLSALACRWHGFGAMLKGHSETLIRDGRIDERMMARTHLTDRDLEEDLRRHGLTDASGVAEARLERNGDISIVKAKPEPRVIEIGVADGVKTVRIELG
ncbi:YetF domain-containing protein [Azospirillum sp. SYSU D00513]|uniref:DUF421 domain-containing protein n=1 Tax=Azospirillum sp. SYSU D00513 TaxID=2812561 RepID=UPI001A965E31|nr:YetF domain-containing protein [Azospirillum sp. SYSU D00513]